MARAGEDWIRPDAPDAPVWMSDDQAHGWDCGWEAALDHYRSLPVEQRMEAMGMRRAGHPYVPKVDPLDPEMEQYREPAINRLARCLSMAVVEWLASDGDDDKFAAVERLAEQWREAVVDDD